MSGEHDKRDEECKDLPKAKVGRDWKTYLFWAVPFFAVALAGYFIYSDIMSKGPQVHIYFTDATGLEAGKSQVQYRGAQVGQVDKIRLTSDEKKVEVTVSLKKSAAGLAREGSQFWIVKAHLGVAQVQGLNTIVSGEYIAVEPGDGQPKDQFDALAEAPVGPRNDVLRVVLLSERLGSVKPRSPVYYRGIQIGQVAQCELGPNAQTVRIHVEINKPFEPLVRVNSVFWDAGGIDATLGMKGADISAQSPKALITGAIDMATPDANQKVAPADTSFRLYEKPQDAWLAWSPAIQLDEKELAKEASGQINAGSDIW